MERLDPCYNLYSHKYIEYFYCENLQCCRSDKPFFSDHDFLFNEIHIVIDKSKSNFSIEGGSTNIKMRPPANNLN